MKTVYQIFLSIICVTSLMHTQSLTDSALIVRDIRIVGNETTKDFVILREMTLQPGDTLTEEAITRDRNNIYNLQLFNKVDVEYQAQGRTAAVTVTVSERWYFIPFPIVGMKYRDPSKLYYGAGVMHVNFRGRNEKVFANIAFGYDRWFMLSYQNPQPLEDDDFFAGATLALQKVHNLSSISTEYMNTNIFMNGTLGRRFGIYQTLSTTFGYEVWQVDDPRLVRTVSMFGRDAFLTAAVQYRYDTRNNREYATMGSLTALSLVENGFGESDVSLTSFSYDLRKFFGFGTGSTFGVRSFGTFIWGGMIPPYKHVFFGYDERIRGFFHTVVEAENRFGVNAEVRLPIFLPRYLEVDFYGIPQFSKLRYGMYFGIFADSGKAWSRSQRVSEQPWYSGVGAGLQFLLPYAFTIRTEAAINNHEVVEYYIDFDTSF